MHTYSAAGLLAAPLHSDGAALGLFPLLPWPDRQGGMELCCELQSFEDEKLTVAECPIKWPLSNSPSFDRQAQAWPQERGQVFMEVNQCCPNLPPPPPRARPSMPSCPESHVSN